MRSGEEALNLPHWTICYFASGGGIAASAVHLLVTKSNKQRVTLVDERAVLIWLVDEFSSSQCSGQCNGYIATARKAHSLISFIPINVS